jgi:hypothetical protein
VKKSKILIGIAILAAIIIAIIVGFLLLRPKYEISYNYEPGEIYVYESKTTTYYLDYKIGTTIGKDRVEVLKADATEITLRHNLSQSFLPPQVLPNKSPQNSTMVYTEVITPKGKTKSIDLEWVYPPQFESAMGQSLEEQRITETTSYPAYPTEALPIGSEWEFPIELEQTLPNNSSLKALGKNSCSLVDRETLTIPAGTFDCLKLISTLHLEESVSAGNLTGKIEVLSEGLIWIDLKKGTQVKGEVHREASGLSSDTLMELIEYIPP